MATPLPQRVPENAPGDFYVEANACTLCCLPHVEAPELLNDPGADFRECHFRRQPQNEAEVERACQAVAVSCVNGLRYGGNDPKVLARLRELGAGHQCDQLAEPRPEPGPEPEPRPAAPPPKRSWWRRLFGGGAG